MPRGDDDQFGEKETAIGADDDYLVLLTSGDFLIFGAVHKGLGIINYSILLSVLGFFSKSANPRRIFMSLQIHAGFYLGSASTPQPE